jgi:hypothetical protein
MTTTSDSAAVSELLTLEDQRCRAISRGDLEALGRLLDDDLTHVHATGHAHDKKTYLSSLAARRSGLEPDPGVEKIVDGDPVPIGLSANRPSFEELLALGREQKILSKPLTVDELFPALG